VSPIDNCIWIVGKNQSFIRVPQPQASTSLSFRDHTRWTSI